MDGFVKAFIKASMAWLALGATLCVAMALQPAWLGYRPAHLHMLTLGFVAMMIFGVGYHSDSSHSPSVQRRLQRGADTVVKSTFVRSPRQ